MELHKFKGGLDVANKGAAEESEVKTVTDLKHIYVGRAVLLIPADDGSTTVKIRHGRSMFVALSASVCNYDCEDLLYYDVTALMTSQLRPGIGRHLQCCYYHTLCKV